MQDNADRNFFVVVLIFWGINITDSVYPELVALIGWNVPNYQGVFLRGYGGQTSYHYGTVGHWSAGLGELQGDGIREIWGELSYLPRSRDGEVGQSGSLAFWNEGRNQWMNDAGKAPSGAMNFYASRSTPVVGEVRPVNRAVRYLIRARWLAKLSESPYLKTQEGRQVLLTPTVPLRGVFFGTPLSRNLVFPLDSP